MTAIVQKLSNNIPVIIETISGAKGVSFAFCIGSGSANEKKDNNGVAHAIEHMLFKGTKKHTAGELADIMTSLGGGINAYTSKENTVFYGKVLPEDFAYSANLLKEMMTESLFAPKEFAKEKCVIVDEIESYDDSAEDMCHELLQKYVWKDNPLGYIISGSRTNVRKLTVNQMTEFINDNYTADNIVISVAGAVSPKEVIDVLEPLFCCIPEKGKKSIPPKPDFNRCFITRYKDMEQVHLNIAFNNVTNLDNDRYAMGMINSLLGGNLNSRLFQKVREENGLTYSIYSYNSMCDTAGLFHIYASMNAGQTKKVVSLIFQIVDKLNKEGIDEKELSELKKQMKTELLLGSDTANSIVSNNARTYMSLGKVISVEEAVEGYNKVTVSDINRCIRKYLCLDNCSICMVGNTKEVPVSQIKNIWRKL